MRKVTFEEVMRHHRANRERVTRVLEHYDRLNPADPTGEKPEKERHPDEAEVLSRFKLK
ncbi:hypothetical protein [Bhargavaea cecembensis]|uniref:hypothetical protein n=1 Tax=Bhargavaea cecembensis TaxID=394098 RepID=UPI0015CF0A52|nr:hypothetical protein [Bhargavaea cecembensis]